MAQKERDPLIEINRQGDPQLKVNDSSLFNTIGTSIRKSDIKVNFPALESDANLPDEKMTYKNIQQYKKKMFIIVTIMFGFCGLIISEKLASEILNNNEQQLLFNVQSYLNLSYYSEEQQVFLPNTNGFLTLIGKMQTFTVNFLLFTHFFISYYVAFDAVMAVYILFPSLLGYYMIVVLQLIYQQPKPFWVNRDIVSFTCQRAYGCPSQMSFTLLLILFYSCHLHNHKYLTNPEGQRLVGPPSHGKRRLLFKLIGAGLIAGFLFCIYIAGRYHKISVGLTFLDHLAIGIIFFGLYYTILLTFSPWVHNIIHSIAFSTQKKMVFRWMFILAVIQMMVLVYHNFSAKLPSVIEMINFIECINEKEFKSYNMPFMIGPEATYSQTSVVFGFIGLLFAVGYAFRNTKENMKWFVGTKNQKYMRVALVNLMMVPSWILIYNQKSILAHEQIIDSGLTEFLLNSIHFISLYFILFGLVPVHIFERFNLNNQNDAFTILPRPKRISEHTAFSFTD